MNSATAFAAVLLTVVLARAVLSAVSPEKALRLALWEQNWWLKLSGLRAAPIEPDVERYIASRKTRVRIIGIIVTVATLFFARLVYLQAK